MRHSTRSRESICGDNAENHWELSSSASSGAQLSPDYRPCIGGSDSEGQDNPLAPPFHECAPKKKRTVFLWTCCVCLCSGMRVSAGSCPACGTARCSYCRVEKTVTRE
ncbi:hypothetical protein BGZ61DRAFT_455336 [Ilyonectria robusta]|uniref:uncharacterized protein n=1 Tax=Ilyonectria robusta TaxID=1079257 RepID=UPI001E8E5BC2|nr:uncharacterized protein BGZ61DRAFT_455336 [Ilyonectria robusta]KAH8683841.1 hypothetical protein BGZ61DRAFT_455336 [Ilyonectria robusta]